MAGIVGPDAYPIRDPRSSAQRNGRILNPVRFNEMGGFTSAAKWWGSGDKPNDMRVERATGQTSTHPTTKKNTE